MKYAMTLESSNRKVGPIPVSYSSAKTCPDACPLKDNGCYAELGPGASHWKKVTGGARGEEWPQFLQRVKQLPKGQLWRHNVAGDLPGVGDDIDGTQTYELISANMGRRGFTYTHKPMTDKARLVIGLANRNGFTVNLSANNLAHADELAELNIGPVVTLLPTDAPKRSTTPGGRAVVACPAEENDVNCADCQACAATHRTVIIGFRAHGSRKKMASRIAVAQA